MYLPIAGWKIFCTKPPNIRIHKSIQQSSKYHIRLWQCGRLHLEKPLLVKQYTKNTIANVSLKGDDLNRTKTGSSVSRETIILVLHELKHQRIATGFFVVRIPVVKCPKHSHTVPSGSL